jgi:hypothetical protein
MGGHEVADAWRARRALKAQADMQLGADILLYIGLALASG